jgi:hypothetical protein
MDTFTAFSGSSPPATDTYFAASGTSPPEVPFTLNLAKPPASKRLYHFTFGYYLPSILANGLDTGEVLAGRHGEVLTEMPWFTERASWPGLWREGSIPDGGHSFGCDPGVPLPFRLTVDVPAAVNLADHYRRTGIDQTLPPPGFARAQWFNLGPVSPKRIKAIHLWVDPATGRPAHETTVGRRFVAIPKAQWAAIAAQPQHRGRGFGALLDRGALS